MIIKTKSGATKELLSSEDFKIPTDKTQARHEFLLLCMLDELEKKTEWEQKFIKDITQKVIDKIPLSFRQNSKLEQIWKKTDTY